MVLFKRLNIFQRFKQYLMIQTREAFSPTLCLSCHKNFTVSERPICVDCLASLPRTEQGKIRQNGLEEVFRPLNEKYVKPRFIRGATFCHYHLSEEFRRLLLEAKFFGKPQIDFQLAEVMAKEFLPYGFWEGIDAIIPIPLHPNRMRERLYNQSMYIARGIQEVTKIPIWDYALVRIKDNPKQSTQPFENRHTNTEGIFEIPFPALLKNQTILLVDDIITSGATITSAMKTLFTVQGCKVVVVALAWAQK